MVFVESDSRAMPCVSDHQCRKKICKGPLYQSNAVDSESPDPFKMTSHIIFCKTIQDREDPMQESSQVMLVVKNPPANAGDIKMRVQSLGWEDPLEEGTAIHSNILAWRIPSTEEPDGLQSTGLQRVGHN